MESKFKIGQQVKLKSGSYPMTVESFDEDDGRVKVCCVWQDEKERSFKRDCFDEETLFKISD